MGHIIINYDSLRLTGGFFGKRSFSTWKTKASCRLTSGQTKKSGRQTLQKWCHVMPQEDIRFFKMLHVQYSGCHSSNFVELGFSNSNRLKTPPGRASVKRSGATPPCSRVLLLPNFFLRGKTPREMDGTAPRPTCCNNEFFTMTSGIRSPKGQHETNSTTQPHFSYFTQLVQGCRLEGYCTQWTYVLQLGVPCV